MKLSLFQRRCENNTLYKTILKLTANKVIQNVVKELLHYSMKRER
jgi:hypothetical protein